mmetsp:Transcript_9000/g.19328  ORF Transcript_9000/g.19328 Transcript_9000/m.19328 type:complete len:189 (+) Transcript_9000:94-660(+)
MSSHDTLCQLDVKELGGTKMPSWRIIVTAKITFYNLHRTLQFCIKPKQPDTIIDKKAYSFKNAASNEAIRALKSAQLNKNSASTSDEGEATVGEAYVYEADARRFRVEVSCLAPGDSMYCVPRCIAGKQGGSKMTGEDLNAINSKLMYRRFSKKGVGQRKSGRGTWVRADATQEQVDAIRLKGMLRPL